MLSLGSCFQPPLTPRALSVIVVRQLHELIRPNSITPHAPRSVWNPRWVWALCAPENSAAVAWIPGLPHCTCPLSKPKQRAGSVQPAPTKHLETRVHSRQQKSTADSTEAGKSEMKLLAAVGLVGALDVCWHLFLHPFLTAGVAGLPQATYFIREIISFLRVWPHDLLTSHRPYPFRVSY